MLSDGSLHHNNPVKENRTSGSLAAVVNVSMGSSSNSGDRIRVRIRQTRYPLAKSGIKGEEANLANTMTIKS